MKALKELHGALGSQKQVGSTPWSAADLTGTAINSRKPVFDHLQSSYSSTRLSILLAALGTCVFFWGLGYKLSLYEQQSTRIHQIPKAKLLSQNEDRSEAEEIQLFFVSTGSCFQDNFSTMFFLLLLVSASGLCASRDWRQCSISRPWCLPLGVIRNAFHFRPPPVFCRK
jgi:hypothetical protein